MSAHRVQLKPTEAGVPAIAVRIALRLSLPQGVRVGERFNRRSLIGQTNALARRAAIVAAEDAHRAGATRWEAIRLGRAVYYLHSGAKLSQSGFYVWEAKARRAGGASTCPLETFLDGRDVPHRRRSKQAAR